MSEEDVRSLRNMLACAVIIGRARHILSDATLTKALQEIEDWARKTGNWNEPPKHSGGEA